MTLFVLMFLAHCIDDFCLQGVCLVNLEQKSWWEKNANNKKYKNDYIISLLIHAFEWSAVINIVMIIFGVSNEFLACSFIVNGLIHALVDDLKANRFKINLIQDQTIHILQIIVTVLLYYYA